MDIRVSGHQVDTGAALQEHAATRLSAVKDKYFSRALSSTVTFGKAAGSAFDSNIIMHVNQGLILKAHARAHDIHHAFDQALDKIEKQLRRYKRRLVSRTADVEPVPVDENAAYRVFSIDEAEAELGEGTQESPLIIAETRVDVPESTVADAVMMLDLRNTNALLFKNAGTGRHNMVYRRDDGSIGWVEPS